MGWIWGSLLLGAEVGQFRLWKDDTGHHSVEAALVEYDGNTVLLRKKDGNTVRVPVSRLSPSDQEFLRTFAQSKLPAASAKQQPAFTTDQSSGRQRLSREELLRRVEPAVVRIETDGGMGSGFFVDRDLVITNYHVIENASLARVKLGNQTYRVLGFLGAERGKDLALLRVDRSEEGSWLTIAAQLPEKLEEVYAFGSPLGLQQTVTRGEVSAIRTCREIRRDVIRGILPPEFDDDLTLIQTTAPISPGNSGGPLVNVYGEVVGVNAGSLSARSGAQNVNFAIACGDLKTFVARCRANPLRNLASLPKRQPSPKLSTSTDQADFRVQLPDGQVFSIKSLIASTKDIEEKFIQGVQSLQTPLVAFKTQVPQVGYVLAGIHAYRTAPVLFGVPGSYTFVWKERPEIQEEKELVGILGGSQDQPVLIIRERTVGSRIVGGVPQGILCYERGRLHGVVNMDLDDLGVYLGVWDRGKPSEKQAQLPKDIYPKGMFVLVGQSQQWTLLIRTKGTQGQMFLLNGDEILRCFDTLDKAQADAEGKAKWDAIQQAEARIQKMAAEIANTCQREAKRRQQEVISKLALQTRDDNIQRSAEQRARYQAGVEAAFRDAARRAGW
ncbi:MAG: trypsin-like peptidase domain-containing protein [Thermoguttaceae bacterium]|nr:trypsin-like peptidase domain-containing protein [Thermoguttaceae bacterium]MDW8036884.1 trypsin-like peptidase domain-containing protein [Thermoguttaceae bacterium]